jgi:7-keto-8-aminopelargonate synthetase-like enzyme
MRELLLRRSRFLRTEPATSPLLAFDLEVGIDLMEGAIATRKKLGVMAAMVRNALLTQGWTLFGEVESPIISIAIDRGGRATELQGALLSRGVLVDAFSVRPFRGYGSLARVLLSIRHTEVELALLLEGLAELRRRMRPGLET